MIEHIVMWKFKENAEGKTKKENISIVKEALEKLPGIIPEIRFLEVRPDQSGDGQNYDAVLITKFDSFEHLNIYKAHPEHQKVSRYVGLTSEKRASVDYNL